MDWNGLHADINHWISSHFTPGRDGHRIEFIVLHHNAGRLSTADCAQVWQTRPASAHYQVEESGRIGQLVHDADTAWHAGDYLANCRSIGIEHSNSGGPTEGWPVSDATVEAGAHLVAALCVGYDLGRPAWRVNVFPHHHFSSTACPGVLAGARLAEYMHRAGEWYDAMVGAPAPMPTPAPTSSADLAVDGILGPASIRRLQEILGTPADGVISAQYAPNSEYVPAAGDGWEWTSTGDGSTAIQDLQRRLGVEADGLIGPGTIRAWQTRLDVTADGYLGTQTAQAIQRALNEGRLW